jgi:hypothetical protein
MIQEQAMPISILLPLFRDIGGKNFPRPNRSVLAYLFIDPALEAMMSRRTILLLAALYFVAAVAFSVFHVATNPFLSGLNTATIGKSVSGALLLFGGSGLLPVLGWALYRFKPQYAMWPMLLWAFFGIALAYFFEIGVRLERDVQISMLARNLTLSEAKLSCLDSQHASKFRSEIGITEHEVSIYCGCVSEATAASMTVDDLTYIATNGSAPQPLQEQTAQLGQTCRRLIMGKREFR